MKQNQVDPGLLAAIDKTLAENHGGRTVSFGMEPPVGDYIKGMQAADARYHASIHKHLEAHDGISGSFHRPVTTGNPNAGEIRREGSGDLEGYSTHQYNSPPRWPEKHQPINVIHKGNIIGQVRPHKDGGFLISSGHSSNGLYARADNQEDALRGIALHHKARSHLYENADGIPDKKTQMLDEVRHNLKMYYHHLNCSKSSEALGEKEHADRHMLKSSERHSRAVAVHQELHSAHGMHGPSFANLKAAARDEVGYKD